MIIHPAKSRNDDTRLGHQTLAASGRGRSATILRSRPHLRRAFHDIYLKQRSLAGASLGTSNRASAEFACALHPGNSVTDTMKALFAGRARFLRKPYTNIQLQDS